MNPITYMLILTIEQRSNPRDKANTDIDLGNGWILQKFWWSAKAMMVLDYSASPNSWILAGERK